MTGQRITGQVALIEDDHTLVINRGTESGVAVGMVFAVNSSTGPVITDPESGRELGRLSRKSCGCGCSTPNLCSRAHTRFVSTDDFYGLLRIPFVAGPIHDVVTVDVGDAVDRTADAHPNRAWRASVVSAC